MCKENGVYTCNGYYSAIKKELNFAICNDRDGLGEHYAKWNKLGEKDDYLYEESKKIPQSSEYNKKEADSQT